MLQKLSGAEYVGCFLHVLQSRNRDVVGKAGIVVLDTMKFFVIVEEDEGVDGSDGGALKMLMKEGSVFNFVVPLRGLEDEKDEDEDEEEEVLEFSIVGSRVCYRSDDRATRKFKARASDDLSALLMKQ
jgi:ribonuclease P protein subunit POP4